MFPDFSTDSSDEKVVFLGPLGHKLRMLICLNIRLKKHIFVCKL